MSSSETAEALEYFMRAFFIAKPIIGENLFTNSAQARASLEAHFSINSGVVNLLYSTDNPFYSILLGKDCHIFGENVVDVFLKIIDMHEKSIRLGTSGA